MPLFRADRVASEEAAGRVGRVGREVLAVPVAVACHAIGCLSRASRSVVAVELFATTR